jgi:hypothetical protein
VPLLSEVLEELQVEVIATVEDWGERLLLIAKAKFKGSPNFPPPPEHCYLLAAKTDNPRISEGVAESIRRHFKPPKRGGFTTLGLND